MSSFNVTCWDPVQISMEIQHDVKTFEAKDYLIQIPNCMLWFKSCFYENFFINSNQSA